MRLVFQLETSRFFAVLSLGVALLFASGAGVLAQGTQGNSNQTQVVFQNEQIQILADVPVSNAQVREISSIFARSYDYACQQSPLPDRVPHDKLISVIVRTAAENSKNSFASCHGVNEIFVNLSSLQDKDRLALGLAHECTHLLHHRAGASLPRYLEEGIAKTIGMRYALTQCQNLSPGARKYLAKAVKSVANLSPRFAEQAIHNDIGKDPDPEHTGEEEYTGQLYFEFIRAKLNGTGVDHALVRINKLIESMPPGLKPATEDWDQAYRSAFKDAFAVGLENVNKKFIKYLQQTAGDTRDRLNRTIFVEAERAL